MTAEKHTKRFLQANTRFLVFACLLAAVLLPSDAHAQINAAALNNLLAAFIAGLLGLNGGGGCGGQTLGGVICNTIESSWLVPGLFSGFSYLFGIILGALGIGKLVEHVTNPNQTPIWDPLKKFLAGSGFLALPMVMESAFNTLAFGITRADVTGFNGQTSGLGLDAMVARLMEDLWFPMSELIGAFGYLAGIVLIMVGISRMLKSAQDGPRGPGGIGTIMTFIVGGALFSIDSMMGAFSSSMFNSNAVSTFGVLQYTTGMTAVEVNHVHAVISSVLAFMIVLGWISFMRGFFILRDVAEGSQQASLMAALTHLFGGALAVNLGPLLNAVQNTLGIGQFGLMFF